MTAANAVVEETNFGTCRSAATVCYLVPAAHELGTPTGQRSLANLLPRRVLQRGKTPGKVAALTLISNHLQRR
jgi:hypothetical protein